MYYEFEKYLIIENEKGWKVKRDSGVVKVEYDSRWSGAL